MKPKIPNGLTLSVIDFPEWKHKVLKAIASILFIKKVNYIILIDSIDEQEVS